jgi:hypothetical protein
MSKESNTKSIKMSILDYLARMGMMPEDVDVVENKLNILESRAKNEAVQEVAEKLDGMDLGYSVSLAGPNRLHVA